MRKKHRELIHFFRSDFNSFPVANMNPAELAAAIEQMKTTYKVDLALPSTSAMTGQYSQYAGGMNGGAMAQCVPDQQQSRPQSYGENGGQYYPAWNPVPAGAYQQPTGSYTNMGPWGMQNAQAPVIGQLGSTAWGNGSWVNRGASGGRKTAYGYWCTNEDSFLENEAQVLKLLTHLPFFTKG